MCSIPHTQRADLDDGTEPAGVADVFQADWVVSESLPLVRIEWIDRDASEREPDLLQGSLPLCQAGLQSSATFTGGRWREGHTYIYHREERQ